MIRRRQTFRQPIAKPKKLGPETNPWYWNPGRFGVKLAPPDFRTTLHDFDPDLEVTWNPVDEKWQVWMKAPSFQHPVCQGWKLLFVVKYADGSYMPLDNRTFARLYEASAAKWGNGRQYFNQVVAQMDRDKERREKQRVQDQIDMAMPFFDHSQIKNIGKGSKFSTYHS